MEKWEQIDDDNFSDNSDEVSDCDSYQISDKPIDLKRTGADERVNESDHMKVTNDVEISKLGKSSKTFTIKDILGLDENDGKFKKDIDRQLFDGQLFDIHKPKLFNKNFELASPTAIRESSKKNFTTLSLFMLGVH